MKEREATGSSSSRSTDTSFYIENLGCAKNQVDAETIIASLENAGFVWKDTPDEAGFIIVNTCGFIESAKKESIETAFELRNRYPGRKLILTGCLAQRYGEELGGAFAEADGIIGNTAPAAFAETLARLLEDGARVVIPDRRELHAPPAAPVRRRLLTFPGSAYLKVGEGCDNRCTYCAIPLIRGSVSSRSVEDVVTEFRELIERGVHEVNLVAQDLASFGTDRGATELPELLERLSEIPGGFWIRLLYIHPDRFPRGILPLVRADRRILPYFDLPFQHASVRVLRRMNRRGDRAAYLDLIREIRETVPDAVLRSTFLLGFPGESARDFDELLRFQEEASLEWVGAFTYSREEGTPAYRLRGRLGDLLSRPAARRRLSRVQEAQVPITERRLDRFVGRTLELLIEEKIEGENLFLARAYLNAPEVDGVVVVHGSELSPGTMVRAVIAKRNGLDLEAVLPGDER